MRRATADESAALDAAAAIRDRHTAAHDDDLAHLDDSPYGAGRYVRTHRAGIPDLPKRAETLLADAPDLITIGRWLRDEGNRTELAGLTIALANGATLRDIAAILGVGSRQAAHQHIRRLTTAIQGETVDRSPAVSADPVRGLVDALLALDRHMPAELVDDLDDVRTAHALWRPGTPAPGELLADLRMLWIDLRGRTLDTTLRALVDQGTQVLSGAV